MVFAGCGLITKYISWSSYPFLTAFFILAVFFPVDLHIFYTPTGSSANFEKVGESMEDIRVLIFAYPIETIMTMYLGLKLLGITVEWKKIILAGIMVATFEFFLRPIMPKLGLPEVSEVFVTIVVLLFVYRLYFGISWGISILSILLGYVVMTIGQVIMMLVFTLFHFNFDKAIKAGWWQKTLVGHLDNLTSYLLFIILNIKPFNILDFSKGKVTKI